MAAEPGRYDCFNEAAANSPRKAGSVNMIADMTWGFNEAAANSPRKGYSLLVTDQSNRSFNEAAANSPRKAAGQNVITVASTTLQ